MDAVQCGRYFASNLLTRAKALSAAACYCRNVTDVADVVIARTRVLRTHNVAVMTLI